MLWIVCLLYLVTSWFSHCKFYGALCPDFNLSIAFVVNYVADSNSVENFPVTPCPDFNVYLVPVGIADVAELPLYFYWYLNSHALLLILYALCMCVSMLIRNSMVNVLCVMVVMKMMLLFFFFFSEKKNRPFHLRK